MGAPSSDRDQAALTAVREAIAGAQRHHRSQQHWAARTRRAIRSRTHGQALEWLGRALRAETEDPEPAPPCDCGICRHYQERRST